MARIAVLLLIPCLAVAQTPSSSKSKQPSAKQTTPVKPAATKPAAAKPVAAKPAASATPEQDVRARVTEFLQYHVEGNFRKAMDMVADDTKDEYFASGKMKLKAFTIESIKLSDKDQKAVVTSSITRDWQIRAQTAEVLVPMVTTWKIEGGKWVWYRDPSAGIATPMGTSAVQPPTKNADGTVTLPKGLTSEVIAAAARSILQGSSLDKNEVKLLGDKASSDKVIFANGAQGSVRLSIAPIMPVIKGLKVTLEKADVGGGEKVGVNFAYEPPKDSEIPETVIVQLITEPLNQVYGVRVVFVKPDAPQ